MVKCEMFKKGIKEFRSRSILFNKLLEQHYKEYPDCTCGIKYINIIR